MRSKASLALVLAVALCAAARAEVQLQSITWQTARWEKGKPQKPQDITVLAAAPGTKFKGRLLAKLKLLNRGPAVQGVLLRYSVTPKIAPIDKTHEAAWALPIVVEERRVPKVGANQFMDVPIDPTPYVDLNIKRLARDGYAAAEFKIDIMLVPRKGHKGPLQIVSSTLPVQ
jgi:hypothetical protein